MITWERYTPRYRAGQPEEALRGRIGNVVVFWISTCQCLKCSGGSRLTASLPGQPRNIGTFRDEASAQRDAEVCLAAWLSDTGLMQAPAVQS